MCDLVGIENNLSLNYVQGFLISTTIITLKYLLAQPTDKKKTCGVTASVYLLLSEAFVTITELDVSKARYKRGVSVGFGTNFESTLDDELRIHQRPYSKVS